MKSFLKSKGADISAMLFSLLLVLAGSLIKIESLSLVVFLVGYAVSAYKVIYKSVKNLLGGHLLDENFLMTVASVGALCIGEHAEAVLVMVFYNAGELFQKSAVEKSRESIMSLMDLCPDSVNVLREGRIETVDPYDVDIGETVIVKSGEKIAIDGLIMSGSSFLDMAALTGESAPISVKAGDAVMSGSVNQGGALYVKTGKRAEESTANKILELIEGSVDKRSRYESFISRFAKYYTPVVVIGAVLVAIIPPLFLSGDWQTQIRSAMVFLMISCPCALVISVPLTFFGGIGSASRMGVLVKGAFSLEELSRVKTVAFDKTGTLTKGAFSVTEIKTSLSKNEFLFLAAHAEAFSDHPIARSVKEAFGGEIDPLRVEDSEEIAGLGVVAKIDGSRIAVGSIGLMNKLGISLKRETGKSEVLAAKDSQYIGSLIISDAIKETSRKAIDSLKKQGIKTVMLSGDRKEVCETVASELGIDEIKYELMPAQKVEAVKQMIERNENKSARICFVGDGINDAPVMTVADVSVAMGGLGSDAAIEASDIVLVNDDPAVIAKAITLSKKATKIAVENIVISLSLKLLVLSLGLFGVAGIWEAIFADVGVSVIAILNAIRMLKIKNK